MHIRQNDPGFKEFIALMALLTSLAAMSIDSMLPALSQIADDLGAEKNQQQYVVSAFLLTFGLAQMVFGPLSDALGRRPVIYIGVGIFAIGSLFCIFSVDFSDMLVGRILQGIGIAGPRVATLALVRDKYAGDEMARVMSLIMMVFILVPMLAPLVGQGILLVAEWRAIFVLLITMAVIAAIWLWLRQPETLPLEKRRAFAPGRITSAVVEVFRTRTSISYIVMSGLIFSAFVGYLSSAQQIFQVTYGVGEKFPFYFGALAAGLGVASYFNSRLVLDFGMRRLCRQALIAVSCLMVIFLIIVYAMDASPPLFLFMAFMIPAFFCFGILFANFAALAMEPLGHIAGVGASAVGSISSLVSVPLGAFIGQQFDGTVLPLVSGLAFFSIASLVLMHWVERR